MLKLRENGQQCWNPGAPEMRMVVGMVWIGCRKVVVVRAFVAMLRLIVHSEILSTVLLTVQQDRTQPPTQLHNGNP